MSPPDRLDDIEDFLSTNGVPPSPEAAVILGSGLGDFASHIENATAIPYSDIPHWPESTVAGHEGSLVFGDIGGRSVLAFSGRFHRYEGCTIEQTALPVGIAARFDAGKLIISNAAGAINSSFRVGDLMVIEDVLRQSPAIATRGHEPFRYDHYPHVERVRELASGLGITIRQGSYLFVTGPSYETRAEIRAFRTMGADAVGMSTAPELAEAARLGVKTAAISLISNMAAGVTPGKLSHADIAVAAAARSEDFTRLVTALIGDL